MKSKNLWQSSCAGTSPGQNEFMRTSVAVFTMFFVAAQNAQADTAILNSNEMHKATDHVSFGIPFFGFTFLTFDKPSEKNDNNIVGFRQVTVWDKGKLVTIKVSNEAWQATMARTTHGCVENRRISKAIFDLEVKDAALPSKCKAIKNTEVKLVSISYYPEYEPD